VFTYHSINDSPELLACGIAVPIARFAEHVKYFAGNRSGASKLETFGAQTASGAAITFDDGDADTFVSAAPLLREFNCPAIVFVSSSLIGTVWKEGNVKRRMLSPEQLKSLAAMPNIEIGSHGHIHVPMTLRSSADLVEDLDRSKKMLEDMVGREVRYLSYPYGCHNESVMSIVEAAGFVAAFGCLDVLGGPYAIRRIGVVRHDTLLRLRLKSAWVYPPLINNFRRLRERVIQGSKKVAGRLTADSR
jgi:peptidoglycan/xylan/chitin deacetylase (PgdA/CDA1 family)